MSSTPFDFLDVQCLIPTLVCLPCSVCVCVFFCNKNRCVACGCVYVCNNMQLCICEKGRRKGGGGKERRYNGKREVSGVIFFVISFF